MGMKGIPAGSLIAVVSGCAALAVLALALDYWQQLGLSLEATRWIGIAYVALIHVAPALIYPSVYRHIPRFPTRVGLCLTPAICWWLSELMMRMRWHSFAEALWLVISPFLLVQLLLMLMVIGLAHVLVTLLHGNKLRLKQVLIYSSVMVAVVAMVLLNFSFFFTGYQSLFQAELLPEPELHPGRLDPESAATSKTELPNILFILSDDHRYDFSGYAGHPFIETPNIDQLAEEGVIFDRAYVSTALCSPSRASFLTGVSPYQHGVWNNFTPWSEQNRTFFEYLRPAGYSTAFIGKWHMPGGKLPEIAGLDHFVSFTNMGGQGTYEWNPMIVNGREVPSRTRYIATELTDYAIEWIEQQTGPFVLYLSHKSVHASFQPDEPDVDRYAGEDAHVPEGAHLWSAHTRNQYVHLTRTPLDTSIRRYGEAIHSMDREIGRLLNRLSELGLEQNTLVIYTSDNGYQWGEHDLTDKRWAYEESIRIPFIMRLPGNEQHRGQRNSNIIANTDVAATFLDAAGIESPDYMEGQSLLQLLDDPDTDWRDHFFYSYFYEPPYPTPTSFALVTDRFKLIETTWKGMELYDLQSDPREQRNLANDLDHAKTLSHLHMLLTREKER